jgi:protein-glutamine gamma-glutamyltransferase
MRLLRSFPLLAFVLVLVSITGFCIAQESPGLLVVAGALAAMSWSITEGPRGRSLPRWVSNVLTAAIAINVMVDLAQNLADPVGVLGRFSIWLALIKLYERKSVRDYTQLLALSLLLMLVGCLQSPELLFGLTLLVYAVLGLYVLLLFQLYRSHDAARAERAAQAPPGHRLAPSVQAIAGGSVAWQARTLVACMVVVGFLISAGVFVVAPRNDGRSAWAGSPGRAGQDVGFSETVDLTGDSRITESRRIVATMRLRDSRGQPLRHLGVPLLRGAVLSRYDGNGIWLPDPERDSARSIESYSGGMSLLAGSEAALPQRIIEQEFAVSPQDRAQFSRTLFAMPWAVRIGGEGLSLFRIDRQTLMIRHVGMGHPSSYRVLSDPNPDDDMLRALVEAPEPGGGEHRYRQAEVRDMALRLLADVNLPATPPQAASERWAWNRAAAVTLKTYLQSGQYTYQIDLSDQVAPTEAEAHLDPTARFLLHTRRGHCEHFASALAAMCQSIGIPARIVTGFAAGEYDAIKQQYVIRESHAHAWCEVLVGPHRWHPFDPTPASVLNVGEASQRSLAAWIRSMYESFEFTWNMHVAGYDGQQQSTMVGAVSSPWGPWLRAMTATALGWMESVNRSFDFGPAGYVWLGVVAFAVVLAVIAAVKITRRVLRLRAVLRLKSLRDRTAARLLRQVGFYLDMLGVLQRGGAPKPEWVPPRQFAEALHHDRPAAAAIVAELTDLYYLARFGGRRLDDDQTSRAQRLLVTLAGELAGSGGMKR